MCTNSVGLTFPVPLLLWARGHLAWRNKNLQFCSHMESWGQVHIRPYSPCSKTAPKLVFPSWTPLTNLIHHPHWGPKTSCLECWGTPP